MIRIQAVNPTRAPIGTDGIDHLVQQYIGGTGFAGGMIRRMADYPPQRPTTYRRTGTLGRNWRLRGPRRTGNAIIAEAVNNTPYAVHVEGPRRGSKGRRQATVMRNKGWQNVTDETVREWQRWRPRIVRVLTQRDPDIQRRRRRLR